MKFVRTRKVKSPQQNVGDAGIDFFIPNDFNDGMDYTLAPHEDVLIPLGVHVAPPRGYALIAFNKSGIATKNKLIKGAEVVDESYQGEIHCHVINFSDQHVNLKAGQKIIQFILIPVLTDDLDEVKGLDILYANRMSDRGSGGFGSTGV